jgi:hypothetical protein
MFCVFPILFEGLILQNRTMNIFHNLALKNVYEKPFVILRITHVFAPQTRFESLCRSVLQAVRFAKVSNRLFSAFLHRKEVIQPHLPIRLPCYDFTPVTGFTFGGSFLTVRSPTSGASNSHGVTGGVYKARERIHRDILIRDY